MQNHCELPSLNALVVDFEHGDTEKQQSLALHLNNLLKDFGERQLGGSAYFKA